MMQSRLRYNRPPAAQRGLRHLQTSHGRRFAARSCRHTGIGRAGHTSRLSRLQPVLHRCGPISTRRALARTLSRQHGIRADHGDIGPNGQNPPDSPWAGWMAGGLSIVRSRRSDPALSRPPANNSTRTGTSLCSGNRNRASGSPRPDLLVALFRCMTSGAVDLPPLLADVNRVNELEAGEVLLQVAEIL